MDATYICCAAAVAVLTAQVVFAQDAATGVPVARLGDEGLCIKIGAAGDLRIESAGESYGVESSFSYPGPRIGWNVLFGDRAGAEEGWRPKVTKVSADVATIEARGRCYQLRRTVTLADGKVDVRDSLTNLREVPTAIMIRHGLTAREAFSERSSTSTAANSTIFLAGRRGSLGVVLNDNVSRLQYEPDLGGPPERAGFRISHFALDKGKGHTFSWTIHVLEAGRDYFDFINRVRRDWDANFTIEGPTMLFWDAAAPFPKPCREKADFDPDKLRAYLKWKKVKVAVFVPFLDYAPGPTLGKVPSRAEHKQIMQKAMRALKKADPDILCLGSFETDWAQIYPERIEGGDGLPQPGKGSGNLTAEQTAIIDRANLPWKDSYKRKANGALALELYFNGGKPQTAISVYPAVGNYQYQFMMDQARFLIEDVGMDGYYIDEFSQAWQACHTYHGGWDGTSVNVAGATGEIGGKYVDCGLVGIQARVDLCQYALSRGKVVVANTYATSAEEQPLPINRFAETQGAFDPMTFAAGAEPPLNPRLRQSHLGSPIGLGIRPYPDKRRAAEWITRAVVTYLRHGMLFYHFSVSPNTDPATTGEGSGGFGPIDHMFPITPVELHKGWILGKERIVTAVSIDTLWEKDGKPVARFFDLTGRAVEAPSRWKIRSENGRWRVTLDLKDWAEIAVVE